MERASGGLCFILQKRLNSCHVASSTIFSSTYRAFIKAGTFHVATIWTEEAGGHGDASSKISGNASLIFDIISGNNLSVTYRLPYAIVSLSLTSLSIMFFISFKSHFTADFTSLSINNTPFLLGSNIPFFNSCLFPFSGSILSPPPSF